ncbi:hypothetical protein VTO42DRAFT_8762 [Malbranchea cinnamomea]
MSLRIPGNPTSRSRFVSRNNSSTPSLVDTFVSLLVAAGYCQKHARRSRFFGTTPHRLSVSVARKSVEENIEHHSAQPSPDEKREVCSQSDVKVDDGGKSHRDRSTATSTAEASALDILPQEFLLDPKKTWMHRSRYKERDMKNIFNFYADILGPEDAVKSLRAVLSNPNKEMAAPSGVKNDRYLQDDMHIPAVARLVSLLEDKNSSNQLLFRTYRDIPSPGVCHLSEQTRGRLLHRFANPPRPRRVYGLRFLAIIDDMCKASLSISPAYWMAAIHMAGRCTPKITESDLNAALNVWRRMENEAKVPSTSVTFNILFDIAIKAGQFRLADKIIYEAKKRNVDFTRFGRVAQIYYQGLRRDAEGVRQAYREFVEAGEIVDTVVLNCVMVSLIRAGRFDLAEQMYQRMGDVHNAIMNRGQNTGSSSVYPQPFDNYAAYRKASRKLGRILGMSAFLKHKMPDQHRVLQSTLPLTPDAKTFHILLSYHVFHTGDLERFLALLRDMEVHFSIPPQGMVYIFLFQGFSKHGGKPKSPWTFERLQAVWAAFLRAVENSNYEIRKRPRTEKRLAKLIWENPLTGEKNTIVRQYPSIHSGREKSTPSQPQPEPLSNHEYESGSSPNSKGQNYDEIDDDEDEDDWRYENTVYLGRRVIVCALYAFHVCGGRQAVLELWSQIERLWRPKTQKLADVVAVKKVLRRLVG